MPEAPPSAARRDGGFTLTELVVAITITGMMLGAISFALLFMLDGTRRTESSVSQARDVSFIQTWLPIDLSSAISFDTDPAADPTAGDVLPGTNVLVIERQNLTNPGQPNYFVVYRYVDAGDAWQLVRFEVRNPGTAFEDVFTVGVAREVMPPPIDGSWNPALPPVHAIDVTPRNPTVLRKAGQDVTIRFTDGSTYTTGGAGLGPGDFLPDDEVGGFVDPASPPSRCGGEVTLVLDSSGSIGSNMNQVEAAAKEIVANFQGTPTSLRIVDFDTTARAVAPSTWNGAAVDLLNLDDAGRSALFSLIDSSLSSGGGTNWEAGMRMAMTDWTNMTVVEPSPHLPTLLIFVTDGDPTYYLNDSGGVAGVGSSSNRRWSVELPTYMAETRAVSDHKSEWGVEFKGIYIQPGGASAVSPAAQQRLKDIVGATEWTSSPADPIGNADVASFFIGEPSELAWIFQQLFAANCGGTVTVQKKVVNSGTPVIPSSGVWHYTTSAGTRDLDANATSAITFDFELAGGEAWVPIIEDPVPGRTLTDVQCFRRGENVTATRVRAIYDENGAPLPNGREVRIEANGAMSCQFIST